MSVYIQYRCERNNTNDNVNNFTALLTVLFSYLLLHRFSLRTGNRTEVLVGFFLVSIYERI